MQSTIIPPLPVKTLRVASTSMSDSQCATVGFFVGFNQAAVDEIMAEARRCEEPAKTTLIWENQPATHLYLFTGGGARYYKATKDGTEVLIYCIYPGDICGMAAILESPQGYIGTAETVIDSKFLVWERQAIRRLAKQYPQLVENVLSITMRYLRRYAKRMIRLSTRTAEQRLADALLRLTSNLGQLQPDGVAISVTNQQLGWAADISEFTASRFLNNWERAGWISKDRGRVIIHTPESLIIH